MHNRDSVELVLSSLDPDIDPGPHQSEKIMKKNSTDLANAIDALTKALDDLNSITVTNSKFWTAEPFENNKYRSNTTITITTKK